MKDIKFLYPSLTRKALTFTIDDGNFKYDKMFLDILAPVGIKGTFNLCSNFHEGKEDFTREFYTGYGIANHCKYHPLVNYDGVEYTVSDEEFDEHTSDTGKVYPVKGENGFFWVIRPNGWRKMIFEPDFSRYAVEGQKELRLIFGEDAVRDFVWPYGEQNNAEVHKTIAKTHRSSRKTGCTFDLDGFAIPKDKYAWSYNANHANLLEYMKVYEEYPDDGELKFFSFGVHSIDFETSGKWDDLRIFADTYGNRPDTYWYASVEDIFDYEEAVFALEISDTEIRNPSTLTVYFELDGKVVTLKSKETYSF